MIGRPGTAKSVTGTFFRPLKSHEVPGKAARERCLSPISRLNTCFTRDFAWAVLTGRLRLTPAGGGDILPSAYLNIYGLQALFKLRSCRTPSAPATPLRPVLLRLHYSGGGHQVNTDLRNLIALQDLELKIVSLHKQISETPLKVQSFQEELQRLKQAHLDRMTHAQELVKKRRALEADVDVMRTKLSKLKDQLMSVKTNKEYTAMLHEIQMAEDKIRGEEDRILEIMEETEKNEQELKSAEKEVKGKTVLIEEEIRRCQSAVPGLETEMTALQEEKAALESRVESELLARYRRIAEVRKGVALAEAKDELCTACHVRIRPQVYADVLRTEDIFACDSCSRILFTREGLSTS